MFLLDVHIIVVAESCRNYFLSLLLISYLFVYLFVLSNT